jgi:hypothetical protein
MARSAVMRDARAAAAPARRRGRRIIDIPARRSRFESESGKLAGKLVLPARRARNIGLSRARRAQLLYNTIAVSAPEFIYGHRGSLLKTGL